MFLGVPPFKETPIFTSYIEHIPRHPTWFVLLVNSFGRDSCSSSHHHGFSWNWQTTEVAFFLQKVSWSNGTSAPNLWFKAFKINTTTSKDWWSFHHINRNSAVSISFAYAKLQNFGYIIIFSAFSSTRGISHILWSYSTQASPWGFFCPASPTGVLKADRVQIPGQSIGTAVLRQMHVEVQGQKILGSFQDCRAETSYDQSKYTLENERLEPENHPALKRKIIWTNSPFLGSMFNFQGCKAILGTNSPDLSIDSQCLILPKFE